MEDPQPQKEIVFTRLCEEFERYYADFDKGFKDATYLKRNSNQPCFVLFGVSGAGKSTTVARLLDRSSASDFYEKIMTDRAQKKTLSSIQDVAIGHTVTSCTVVPKPYAIGTDISVCDMPGFAETDPQKKISIDVLQKCFLTRVPSSRLLVVAEMSALYEEKCLKLMKHYHTALSGLMGTSYENAIDHLYFVITKNFDGKTSQDVQNRLNSVSLQMIQHNRSSDAMIGVRFLARMATCHIIVDLENDDHDGVLNKLNNMVDQDREMRHQLNRVQDWKIDRLEAGENKLNELCVDYVNKAVLKQEELQSELTKLRPQWIEISRQLQKETDEMRVKKTKAAEEKDRVKKIVDGIAKDMDEYPNLRKAIEERLKEAGDICTVHQRQADLFREHFTTADFVSVRCDVSTTHTSRIGGKTTYKINLNADVTSDGSKEHFVLVMEYEENDETLKSFINRDGSIVPTALSDIREIDLAGVLYNSHKHINRCGAVHLGQHADSGVFSLTVERKKPFKVYIYSSHPFRNMPFFDVLQNQFENEVKRDAEKIKMLKAEIKSLDAKHERNRIALREHAEEMSGATALLEEIKEAVKELEKFHDAETVKMVERVAEVEERVRECEEDEIIVRISSIARIFRVNKISTAVNDPLERFKVKFGQMRAQVKSLKDETSRFQRDDHSSLMDIQAFDIN